MHATEIVENADGEISERVFFTGVNDYKTETDKDEAAQNGGDANENVNWATRLSSHMIEEAVAAVLESSDDEMKIVGGPDAHIPIDLESEDSSKGTAEVDTTRPNCNL